jgi:NAD(P)-dependent dehydrogenase (short-subunit alcohol dehydrogenase family)
MKDPLQYEGKRVVVTGCASGMGEATAQILVDLGARVTGIDVKPTAVPIAEFMNVDLRDRSAIEAAAAAIPAPVHAIFSIAGLPGPPFTDVETVMVNFFSARHLIELLVPKMPRGSAIALVASNAGLGWQQEVNELLPVVTIDGFDNARAWCDANPGPIKGGYAFSKKLANVWVAYRAASLIERGIRLNCTNPGPTQTPMMPTFEHYAGKDLMDQFIGPSARRSTSEEQAWPLIFLNSPRASYVAGEGMHTDAGFLGAMVTGQIVINYPR